MIPATAFSMVLVEEIGDEDAVAAQAGHDRNVTCSDGGCMDLSSKPPREEVSIDANTISQDALEVHKDNIADESSRDANAAQAAMVFLRRLMNAGPDASLEAVANKVVDSGLPYTKATAANLAAIVAGSADTATPYERRRKVRFDMARNEVYEITPYGEIYGLRPRDFVFDRYMRVLPSGDAFGFVDVSAAAQREKSTRRHEDIDSDEANGQEAEWAEDDFSDDDDDWYAEDWRVVVHRECAAPLREPLGPPPGLAMPTLLMPPPGL